VIGLFKPELIKPSGPWRSLAVLDRSSSSGGELDHDVASVGQRPGQPIELGHDQGVAGPARGHRLAQPGPGPIGFGEPWST